MPTSDKYQRLQNILRNFDSVAIAFSGGVDSTLLLKVACDSLGTDNVIALTSTSPLFPEYEIAQSKFLASELGVKQQFIASNDLNLNDFTENSSQRCYHCKYNIFSLFLHQLKGKPHTLLDGSNLDDLDDYRPGRKALTMMQVRSPLQEAQLTKKEIRELSQQLNLSTWNKQAFACLATRFPYGTTITAERLQQIDSCENWLRLHGFANYRVRYHNQLARIEVASTEIFRLLDETLRLELVETFKLNGFDYVTLDLQGYRTGSMNGSLTETS